MRKTLYIASILAIFASCKQSKEDMLVGKWAASSVSNPQQDSFLKEQELFIDTFGRNNDDATNIKEYGFSNVDSARQSLKQQYEDYKSMQQHSIDNTMFDFRKTGVVVMNFSGQVDSANWYLDKEGKLIMDEAKLKGTGNTIKMDIIELADASLKLKFTDQNGTSTVSFQRSKK